MSEEKKMDYTLEGEFSKFEDDERLAFGWASITKKDGEPVVDRQGDFITTGDLEKSAYEYVLGSRVGGEMHKKELVIRKVGTKPKEVATLVESMVFTPEKIAKMGLPEEFPEGWWIGFKVHDNEVWKSVKDGKYNSFSIHGVGKRTPIRKTDLIKERLAKTAQIPESLQEMIDTYGAERVAKHLIGQHEQSRHNPNKHSRSEHKTRQGARKGASIGATLGGAGGFLQGAAAGSRGGLPGALVGGTAGGLAGAAGGGLQGAGIGAIIGGHFTGNRNLRQFTQHQPPPEGTIADQNKKTQEELEDKVLSFGKASRRRQVLSELGNVAKAETFHEQVDSLADDFAELRKSGEINHEFDIPVDEETYADLAKHFSEEVVDKRYEGEWVTFEDYLGAFSDVVKNEDETGWKILASYL